MIVNDRDDLEELIREIVRDLANWEPSRGKISYEILQAWYCDEGRGYREDLDMAMGELINRGVVKVTNPGRIVTLTSRRST